MVRYFCGECFTDHDNAHDCPHYSRVGKSYEKGQKVANNFKKRSVMKSNNYADPKNAPKKGCAVVVLASLGTVVTLSVWGVIKWVV